MDGIRTLLSYLFGEDFWEDVLDEANDIHKRIAVFLGYLTAVALVAVGFNLAGLKYINFYLAIILNIGFFIVSVKSTLLVYAGALGAVSHGGKQPVDNAKEMMKKWIDLIGYLLLYLTIFLIASGILSYRSNPGNIVVVLAGLMLFFWMDKKWGMKTAFPRKIIFAVNLAVVVIGIASFIPRSVYIKYAGFSPFDILVITEVEDIVSDIEKLEKKNAEDTLFEKLEKIKEKMKNGQALTDGDQKLLLEQKKERDKNNIPARVWKATYTTIEAFLDDDENSNNGPALTPEQLLQQSLVKYTAIWGPPKKIKLNKDEWTKAYVIQGGDRFLYLSLYDFLRKAEGDVTTYDAYISKLGRHKYTGIKSHSGRFPLLLSKKHKNTTVYAWVEKRR